jgi:small ligand-binding sensory domain FIST
MPRFIHAHATHPDWRMALGLVAAQLEAAAAEGWQPTIGWLYFTDHHAAQAEGLVAAVRARWPGVQWVGGVAVGVLATGVEYIDEPALVVMLGDLPARDFRVFSGAQPLSPRASFTAATAQIHADPNTADLAELISEMSDRTDTGYLFGGLIASRAAGWQVANGLFEGGLSGVAFSPRVAIVSRVTQGCQPIGPRRQVTRAERNLILELDGAPALDCLLQDVDAADQDPRAALAKLQRVLVGLGVPGAAGGAGAEQTQAPRKSAFGEDTLVRHLVGFDPAQRGVAVADLVLPGQLATFCVRDTETARRDLVRIGTEIRDELEPESWPQAVALTAGGGAGETPAARPAARIAGAVYVSCSGRGGPHFGGPSAELQLLQHALGDVPLVGFFAAGEVAHHRLFGYTGVLTVFAA